MAISHSGCKVYMPIDCNSEECEISKKQQLQEYLNSQPLPVIEPILA